MVKVIKPKRGAIKQQVNRQVNTALRSAMRRVSKMAKAPNANFGAVATVNTAPVAIGNSVRGSKSVVRASSEGVVVSGRDFAFTPVGTSTVATWTICGGTPLCPAAFGDTAIRQYMQMYQKFKWRRLIAHYITSSPTSSTGDVMFYRQKNRNSVFLNQTSSQLLPFVMSDEDTIIGPQWTNHSCDLSITPEWRSTDYGMNSDLNEYAAGDLFLLSKTNSTDSPGYVIFDYVIEFRDLQISPRLLTLPIPRIQWYQTNLGITATAVTVGDSLSFSITGNDLSGTWEDICGCIHYHIEVFSFFVL